MLPTPTPTLTQHYLIVQPKISFVMSFAISKSTIFVYLYYVCYTYIQEAVQNCGIGCV